MKRLFKTSFIFLFLLSARTGFAQTPHIVGGSETESIPYSTSSFVSTDFSELIGIPSKHYSSPIQPYSDLTLLYHQASHTKQDLDTLLSSISAATQTQAITAPLKSVERAQAKIHNKLEGDGAKITDLARGSLVADNVNALMRAYQALIAQVEVVGVKNRFAVPKASGYRDLNLLVKLPKSNMICEVQLHLRQIADIKSGPEHQTYQHIQNIQARAKHAQRALSEFELASITQLRQDSFKLYQKAWLNYKRMCDVRLLPVAAA
ncbi:RelA/SpoT domain-containing protein [Shewanella surugensis]|uniref:RelA/SpoT domain-containing protein n=1 Tax=Shewanella surugensis TaxID=212020 RepID=A0ABT0L5J3_9GAMM|nr:RelA/SpoT domain-containing protein [Shewanella surugensis]MCL1122951.1 RelA/SpoT domain-containing protein [Shewanella surugensis]